MANVAIRTALADAYLGDTKVAKTLFADPATFDQRLVALLDGLGQADETVLPGAISGDDLKAFLAAFGTTQVSRLAEVARLRNPFVPSSGTFVFDDFVTYPAFWACRVYFTVCEIAPSSYTFSCRVRISGARPVLVFDTTSISVRQISYRTPIANPGLVERFIVSLFSRSSSVVYSSEAAVDIYSVSGGVPTISPSRNKPAVVEMIISPYKSEPSTNAYNISLNLVNKGHVTFLGTNWPDFTFQGTVLPEATD